MNNNNTTSTPTTAPTPPVLTLNDIAVAIKMIDVVTKRGAFEGPELLDVGTLRSRFVAFLDSNPPKSQETAQETEGPVVETVAPVAPPQN